jgi:hypothetical protein
MLVDTGATVSVMKPGIAMSEVRTTHITAMGITGNTLRVLGTQDVMFTVGNKNFTHEFLIAALDAEYSGILGVDVLRHMGARVGLRTSTLLLGQR